MEESPCLPSIATEPALAAEGWEARFLADPGRAEEAMALYRGLGLEAMARPLDPARFDARCAGCASTACRTAVVVYTRRPRG